LKKKLRIILKEITPAGLEKKFIKLLFNSKQAQVLNVSSESSVKGSGE
jgi:hypothetical protein